MKVSDLRATLGFLLITLYLISVTAGRRLDGRTLQSSFCSSDSDCNSTQVCRPMFRDCQVPKKCFPTTNIGNICNRNSDCWDTDPNVRCDSIRCQCADGLCTCGECFTEVNQQCELVQSRVNQTGTSFHTGFLYSLSSTSGNQYLYIQSPYANVNISAPFLSLDGQYEVINSIVIPLSPSIQVQSTGVPIDKVVYINSDNPVSVYWLNYKSFSADGGRVLSDEELGKEYIITGDRSGSTTSRFEHFLIVSLKDNTIVNIKYPDSSIETVSLDSMQAFRRKRNGISGTIIMSNELIAVKSGHECFRGDSERCDLMSEQIPPLTSLGCIHIIGYMKPFLTSFVRILIPFNKTDVTIYDENGNCLDALTGLNRGDTFVTNYSNVALSVISTKQVLVFQYGDDYEVSPVRDSSLMQILSIDRYISTYDFYVPNFFEPAILEIIIESTFNTSGLLLDNTAVNPTETVSVSVPGYETYYVIYADISVGYHSLKHTDGAVYTAFIYARRQRAEYAIVL